MLNSPQSALQTNLSTVLLPAIKEAPIRLAESMSQFVPSQSSDWTPYDLTKAVLPIQNRYHAIRHGRSEANEGAIYSGDTILGRTRYPLVALGERQVLDSVAAAIRAGILDEHTIVVTSSYLRARQTAHLSARLLGVQEIFLDDRIGERGIGSLEGRGAGREAKIRLDRLLSLEDSSNPFNTKMGRESTVAVLSRVTELISELERAHHNQNFLLVSHHDAIQIVRTALSGSHPGEYHRVGKLQNAEIVELFPK